MIDRFLGDALGVLSSPFRSTVLQCGDLWGDLCDFWVMKLNASKTKTMIVFRSRTMYPQSLTLTIDGTELKQSYDLDITGVTFDSKMTFEKHLRSVSRAASQRLGIFRKSWRVYHDRSLLGRCFRVFVKPV